MQILKGLALLAFAVWGALDVSEKLRDRKSDRFGWVRSVIVRWRKPITFVFCGLGIAICLASIMAVFDLLSMYLDPSIAPNTSIHSEARLDFLRDGILFISNGFLIGAGLIVFYALAIKPGLDRFDLAYSNSLTASTSVADVDRDFILYLRPFYLDYCVAERRSHNLWFRFVDLVGLRSSMDVEEEIVRATVGELPVMKLGTDRDLKLAGGVVRTSDADWQSRFRELAEKASVIAVIPIAEQGTLFEIQTISSSALRSKTVYVLPPESKLVNYQSETFPGATRVSELWNQSREILELDAALKLPKFKRGGGILVPRMNRLFFLRSWYGIKSSFIKNLFVNRALRPDFWGLFSIYFLRLLSALIVVSYLAVLAYSFFSPIHMTQPGRDGLVGFVTVCATSFGLFGAFNVSREQTSRRMRFEMGSRVFTMLALIMICGIASAEFVHDFLGIELSYVAFASIYIAILTCSGGALTATFFCKDEVPKFWGSHLPDDAYGYVKDY